ncbi:MAG TPA: MFS transporter [Kineosporiaceae bacterium]|nr:MFS transporter [Kineosporiaceae bacterium]
MTEPEFVGVAGGPVGGRVRLLRPQWFDGLPREVAVLSAVAFCVALGFGIVAPALPVFAKSFGVTATQASSVISVFALLRLISAVPAGWLIDRIGERAVLAVGLSIVAVSSALAGLSTTFDQLLVLRGAGGLGSAMFSVSAMALLLRSVGPDQRGRAAGAFQGGFLLGGVAGPAVGGLVTGISIRLPFFVYAATLAAAVVVVVTMMARTQLRAKDATDPLTAEPAGTHGWATLRRALGQRAYMTVLTVNLGNGFTSFGLRSAIVPLFVVYALRLSPAWTGYGLLASALVQAILLLPAGRLADTRGRKPALIIGTASGSVGFSVLALSGSIPMFLIAMGILGGSAALLGSAPAAVVGDITGGRRSGPVVATYQMMSDVGAVAGPLIAGYIVDRTGSYETGFFVGAAVIAVAFALSTVMPETLRSAIRRPAA